jgi:uncharacterized protein (TIGR00251 family)
MNDEVVWESEVGTFLKITVKPRSKRRVFLEFIENEIIVNLQSAAKNGKANVELLKKLSKILSVSSSELRIVAGHKSKTKIILIEGLPIDGVKSLLHTV